MAIDPKQIQTTTKNAAKTPQINKRNRLPLSALRCHRGRLSTTILAPFLGVEKKRPNKMLGGGPQASRAEGCRCGCLETTRRYRRNKKTVLHSVPVYFEAFLPPVPPGGSPLAGSLLVVRPITSCSLRSRFSLLLSCRKKTREQKKRVVSYGH